MSTLINLGYDLSTINKYSPNNINNTPVMKKDINNDGWNYTASKVTDYTNVFLYKNSDNVPVNQHNLKDLNVRINLNNSDFSNIPLIEIKTEPIGDGSDYDPEYHDLIKLQVLDNNRYETKSDIYLYYETFPDFLRENLHYKLYIVETLGTHNKSLNIKSIKLYTLPSATTNFNLISHYYQNKHNTTSAYTINYGIVNKQAIKYNLNELTTSNNKILEKDNKNGYAQILLGSAGCTALIADSTIKPIIDQEKRQGLKFVNATAGTKYNLYFFDGTQETVLKSEILTLYSKLFIDVNSAGSCIPFFHIYTKAKLDGTDAQPWYNSKWTFTIDLSTEKIGIGEEVVLYYSQNNIDKPNKKFTNRLIKLNTETIDGTGTDGEVLYLVLGSDSGATQNTVNHTINLLGYNFSAPLSDNENIYEKNFNLLSMSSNNLIFPNVRQYGVNILTSTAISPSADIAVIDMQTETIVHIYGTATANHGIDIFQSDDNVNFYFYDNISPKSYGANYDFHTKIKNTLRYVKLINENHSNTFTLNYTIFQND